MDFFGFFICVFCCSLQDLCFTDCIGIRFLCEFLQVFCFYVFDWSLQNMFYGFFVDFFRVSFLLWSFFLISSGIWFLCGFLPWGLFFFSFFWSISLGYVLLISLGYGFFVDFFRVSFLLCSFFLISSGIWFLRGFLPWGLFIFLFVFDWYIQDMVTSSWISLCFLFSNFLTDFFRIWFLWISSGFSLLCFLSDLFCMLLCKEKKHAQDVQKLR